MIIYRRSVGHFQNPCGEPHGGKGRSLEQKSKSDVQCVGLCFECTECPTRASLPCTSFRAQGFDEYMNLVLDDAEEVNKKKGTRKTVGEWLTILQSVFSPLFYFPFFSNLFTTVFPAEHPRTMHLFDNAATPSRRALRGHVIAAALS